MAEATAFRQLEHALGGTVSEQTTFLLYGQRGVGKTSALFQLPRRLGIQVIPALALLLYILFGSAGGIASA